MRLIVTAMVCTMLVLFAANTVKAATYPTITIYLSNGDKIDIEDKFWKSEVYTALYDKEVSNYSWDKDERRDYVFFDKSLKGLNPFGLDFINAVKEIIEEEGGNNITVTYSKKALLKIANLDSDKDGYSNKEELDAGSLPGFADDTPEMHKKGDPYMWVKYGVVAGIIVSIFVVYFIFRR